MQIEMQPEITFEMIFEMLVGANGVSGSLHFSSDLQLMLLLFCMAGWFVAAPGVLCCCCCCLFAVGAAPGLVSAGFDWKFTLLLPRAPFP